MKTIRRYMCPRSRVNGRGLSLAGLACMDAGDRDDIMRGGLDGLGAAKKGPVEGQWKLTPNLARNDRTRGYAFAVSQAQKVGGKIKWVTIGFEGRPTGLPKGVVNKQVGVNPMTFSPTINPTGRIIPATEKVIVGPITAPYPIAYGSKGEIIPNLPTLQSPVGSPMPKALRVGEGEIKPMSPDQWRYTQAASARVQTAAYLTPPGSVNVVVRNPVTGGTQYLYQPGSTPPPPATGAPSPVMAAATPAYTEPPASLPFPRVTPSTTPAIQMPNDGGYLDSIGSEWLSDNGVAVAEPYDFAAESPGGSAPDTPQQYTDYFDMAGDEIGAYDAPASDASTYVDQAYEGGGDYLDQAGLEGLGWAGLMTAISAGAKIASPAVSSIGSFTSILNAAAPIVSSLAPLAASFLAPKGQAQTQQALQYVGPVANAVNSLLPAASQSTDAVNQIAQLLAQVGAALTVDKTKATAQAASTGQQLPQGVFVGPNGQLMRVVPNASRQAVQQSRLAAESQKPADNTMLMLGGFAALALVLATRKRGGG